MHIKSRQMPFLAATSQHALFCRRTSVIPA